LYNPGFAELGTAKDAVNDPSAFVVAVAFCVPLNVIITVSVAAKPDPVTVTVFVGGPTCGLSVMVAVEAAAGLTINANANALTSSPRSHAHEPRPNRPAIPSRPLEDAAATIVPSRNSTSNGSGR
jgi:hypothetical protein